MAGYGELTTADRAQDCLHRDLGVLRRVRRRHQRTSRQAAPPARRPSPPGRRDRQPAAPAGRLQVHGREPRAGSTWPCCRSRSSPLAARWSIATKRRAGGRPAPRSAGDPAWLRPPTPRRSAAPVPVAGFHSSAGPPAREDGRRAARSRFRAGEAPLMDYLAVLRGARSPPRVGLGLAAAPHTPQGGPRRRVPSPPTPPCGACRRRACSRWRRSSPGGARPAPRAATTTRACRGSRPDRDEEHEPPRHRGQNAAEHGAR